MLRSKTRPVLALPLMTAALALAVSGCSGKTAAPEPEEGPLGKYLTALWDTEEWNQEFYDEQNIQIEELVAACMQKEGFEYIPDTQNTGTFLSDEDLDGPEWGTEEFAKEFGYGMSTDPWSNQGGFEEGGDEYIDPNGDYVASLSESEQEAFYETLYGAGPSEEQVAEMEETGNYTSDWTQEGCYGAATHEIEQDGGGSGMEAYEDPEFTDLFEAMDAMYMQLWDVDKKHPDLTQLDLDWAACMSDSGYSEYSSPDDANTQISEELNEIYMMGNDPEGEWVEPTPAESAKMEAAVKDFQKHEIAVATADFACKKKLAYDEKVMKLQFDLEQQFVDENKAALDALLAKHAVSSKK